MNVLVKIWLNIGILGQNKIGLVFGFCVCHFIGIGLVSVCHFPENDISSTYFVQWRKTKCFLKIFLYRFAVADGTVGTLRILDAVFWLRHMSANRVLYFRQWENVGLNPRPYNRLSSPGYGERS